jgi:hypothetical protein
MKYCGFFLAWLSFISSRGNIVIMFKGWRLFLAQEIKLHIFKTKTEKKKEKRQRRKKLNFKSTDSCDR